MKACQSLLFALFLLFCQTAFAQTVNSSVTIRISGGNYVVSGVVWNEFVKNAVIEKIKIRLGANADFSRLTVKPNVGYFELGWLAELDAALLKIKSWKSGVFIFSNQKRAPNEDLPREIADARFLLTDGQTVSVKDFPNKVVVLFLFATWSEPCIKQAEVLSRIYSKINSPNLEIIALNVDDAPQDKANLRKFIAKRDFKYKFGWTSENVVESFSKLTKLNGVPQVLVTVNGRLRGIFTGYTPTQRKLEETILRTLDENNL